jgi:ketosteroid isomerase-like protein
MNIRRDTEPSDWQEEIHSLERENCRAFVARDFEALDRMWSDDLAINSPINRVHDKKRLLELLRAGKISHASLECHAELTLRHDQYVVVMGHEQLTDRPGEGLVRRRYTNIWRLEQGSWRLVVRHANIIASLQQGG